ncbi:MULTISPECIES: tRNA pseudouridine(55) synthase TruB [Caldimonas]|uniref:tRNA pseudouridine(55) synthase TruB n=1 Tax=Caldimonas TaxID=196013 RepID=UPI00036DE5C3|nr:MULTISPECIES: tRNA pseudouridine(55) synthase TruB [Caldimonas]GIX25348.1 MAG: tRNA pseudouridine synthase B [Caldimonas sp.]
MPAAVTVAPARHRIERRALHGVLLLDKPRGLSSNDALQKVKRLLQAQKAGHTGTLDPLATGLLPLCFGAATKFSQVSLEADKAYRAVLQLGRRTTTGDAEGAVIDERPVSLTQAQVEAALARFTGEVEQIPPMHSALKREGRPLYEYARAGVEVERQARRVKIHRLDLVAWRDDRLEIDVLCSKGTYVRTLAEDLGQALGCGAHLLDLRRTASGPLSVGQAVTLERLEQMAPAERDAQILSPDVLLAHWPAVHLAADEAGRFLSGMRRRLNHPDAQAVRVYGPQAGAFLGSARIRAGELIPMRLLSPPEVQALLALASHSF